MAPPSAEGLKQKEAGESLYVDLVFVLTGILPLLLLPSLFFVMKPITRVVRD